MRLGYVLSRTIKSVTCSHLVYCRKGEHFKKVFAAILLDLGNNGILQSQKRKGGGYMLRIPTKLVDFS